MIETYNVEHSSVFNKIIYNRSSRLMIVHFKNENIYEYISVYQKAFDKFINSSSLGYYFNRYIKDDFAWIRLK